MIDLRRLHVLRAVDHYGTVTAAARALHFTPSAASQQIRQLGRELGVALLEPDGRRVRLTPAAHRLLAHADDIQARWERAERDVRADGDEPAGLLRLISFTTAVTTLLAPAAAALSARHPRLTTRISEVETGACFDLLFDGHADLAVVETTPDEPPSRSPSCSARSKTILSASVSSIWNAWSTGAPSRFAVIRPWPIPSVIELPSALSSPVV